MIGPCTECAYGNLYNWPHGECRRHAPIVKADDEWHSPIFPSAAGSCGDFEPKPKEGP